MYTPKVPPQSGVLAPSERDPSFPLRDLPGSRRQVRAEARRSLAPAREQSPPRSPSFGRLKAAAARRKGRRFRRDGESIHASGGSSPPTFPRERKSPEAGAKGKRSGRSRNQDEPKARYFVIQSTTLVTATRTEGARAVHTLPVTRKRLRGGTGGLGKKEEATRADRGPIPRVRSRFDSSVYGSANCCRTTRFGSIIARWFQTLPARRSGGAKKEAATAYRGTIPRANRRFIASIALSAASFPLPDPADLIPPSERMRSILRH